ncbi:glycosyltransferase family 4 protein [Helicobacter salomonis]|uniref:glycosyltransferase family 4 protein n=1 Tax=Helicobacter salomonis TaxID=56878 RepID=UPI001F3AC5AF|nr:glycosyltransferase family 4 protein [Helicobacter salomonis]
MTILYCTEQYYPLQTGTATADYGLTLALSRAGYRVYVITSNMFNHQKLIREGSVHSVSSGGLSRIAIEIAPNLFVIEFQITSGRGGWYGETQYYQDFVQTFECDLLVNVSLLTWNTDFICDKLPRLKAKKKILRTHGEYAFMSICFGWKRFVKDVLKFVLVHLRLMPQGTYPWWLRRKLQKSLRYYNRVFLLHQGSHAYNYLKPYCTSMGILPNGIFAKDICAPKHLVESLLRSSTSPSHSKKSLKDFMNTPYLLNVSNFYKEKGQEFVLRAYYLGQANIPLIFIGSLNADNTLESLESLKIKLDHEHGVREVVFLYGIEREQVLAFYQNATLFLHGSQAPYEAFPMVILESMQFGMPFVCTDVGNVRDLCTELVVNTPLEMAHKIDALLGDPDYYNRISQELHDKVKEYTYENIITMIEAVIKDH